MRARFKRRHGSTRAAMRKREAIEPRKCDKRKSMWSVPPQAVMERSISENVLGSAGVIERGERTRYVKCTREVWQPPLKGGRRVTTLTKRRAQRRADRSRIAS